MKRDVVPGMYSVRVVRGHGLDLQVQPAKKNKVEGEHLTSSAPSTAAPSHSQDARPRCYIVSEADYKAFIDAKDAQPAECEAAPTAPSARRRSSRWVPSCSRRTPATPATHRRLTPRGPDRSRACSDAAKQLRRRHRTITVDENYIRQSILQPQAKIVKSYTTAVMPPFVMKISIVLDWSLAKVLPFGMELDTRLTTGYQDRRLARLRVYPRPESAFWNEFWRPRDLGRRTRKKVYSTAEAPPCSVLCCAMRLNAIPMARLPRRHDDVGIPEGMVRGPGPVFLYQDRSPNTSLFRGESRAHTRKEGFPLDCWLTLWARRRCSFVGQNFTVTWTNRMATIM